ncbi:HesA/MoeB/ThiF family protein [Marinifaba aquimaris]|uniref:HesA/MoeB/ThiF family protein n=1 Tax=Marinifaba aquimaris TaxID=2741323 RepID=UPI001C2DA869|nr:HesA/MoeB/ThiF family protein [Marinifaba aquimaris]
MLSDKEQLRYARHLLVEHIAEAGQVKLKQAKVVIVGVGGLGCPAALYLTAAGVGELTLIEHDKIELSNLQRQILYKTNHLKRSKVEVAQQQLGATNPEIKINAINQSVFNSNFTSLIQNADVVLDCTDNFKTRYFINQACVDNKVPLVTAAAIAGNGQLMAFNLRDENSPCYACLFPEPEPNEESQAGLNCATAGVISPLLGVMGSLQALETMKLILGQTKSAGKLTSFDAWQLSFSQIGLRKAKSCKCCN